jgi:hypothetical protein
MSVGGRVPDARAFAHHRTRADGDAGHGDEMDAARDNGAISYGDNCWRLGFQMHIGLEEYVFLFLNLTRTVYKRSEHDNRSRQRDAEIRRERSVAEARTQGLAEPLWPEKDPEWGYQERFA